MCRNPLDLPGEREERKSYSFVKTGGVDQMTRLNLISFLALVEDPRALESEAARSVPENHRFNLVSFEGTVWEGRTMFLRTHFFNR